MRSTTTRSILSGSRGRPRLVVRWNHRTEGEDSRTPARGLDDHRTKPQWCFRWSWNCCVLRRPVLPFASPFRKSGVVLEKETDESDEYLLLLLSGRGHRVQLRLN